MIREDQDPFAGIKQQLKNLAAEKAFSETELLEVIDAVIYLTDLPQPSLLQRMLLKLRIITDDDVWRVPYQQKKLEMMSRLTPHQLEAVDKVIVEGVLGAQ